jgi:hypothetical protein
MNDILSKVGGKKMFALIAYVLLLCFKDKIGISPADFEVMSKSLMVYFAGQSFADGWSKGKTSHTS